MVVNLCLTLEYAVIDITHLSTHWMTNNTLHAISAKGSISSNGLRNLCNLVAIGSDVTSNVILEITNLATIADVELNTLVEHLASINPLATSFTHNTDTWHIHQNVLSFLVIPFKRTIESVAEETKVETEVGLCSGLPLQIVITQLVALETACQLLAAICTGNVVTGAVTLTAKASLAIITLIESVAGNI